MADSYVVLAGALRLRKQAPGGTVLTILPRGHVVEATGTATGTESPWLHVKTSIYGRDFRGYVHTDYVMPAEAPAQSHPSHSESVQVNADQLLALAPTARSWIVKDLAADFDSIADVLNSPRRLCHFLAQAAHESDGFRTLEEYGGPAYWKKYDGRLDLGNTEPGDGALFHGRGIFQLTGRANYRKMGQVLDIDLESDPDLAAEAKWSLEIACEYWKARKLEQYADRNDITTVTKRINGGLNGFEERKRYFRRAWSIWGETGVGADV